MSHAPRDPARPRGLLGFIERIGNRLPDPVFLFVAATLVVVVASAAASSLGWQVVPRRPHAVMETVTDERGAQVEQVKRDASGRPVLVLEPAGEHIRPRSLVTSDGAYWLVANMVRNFVNFPPLRVELVSIFGIGVAEQVGLFAALMKWIASLVPSRLLTPTVVFLGVTSNIAGDAGFIVVPPLAGALFAMFKRPPIAGIAASFAGLAAGFSANLLVGPTDALIAGITETGAKVLEPHRTVLATCNWWFMAASTLLLTLLGWGVTARITEPRAAARAAASTEPAVQALDAGGTVTPREIRGLRFALAGLVASVVLVASMLYIPRAPLEGRVPAPALASGELPASRTPAPGLFSASDPAFQAAREHWTAPVEGVATLDPGFAFEARGEDGRGQRFRGSFRLAEGAPLAGRLEPPAPLPPRWSTAVVPLIFLVFLVPGAAYGITTGAIRRPEDISRALFASVASMAPVVVMAFFAAQFLACLRYSRLDEMLAHSGGSTLVSAGLPPMLLLVALIGVTMCVNMLMSSMSAKWSALAPIFVPMLMMVGISPELTQVAYRVGDSCTNAVTPLNVYLLVILVACQKWDKTYGIGNVLAAMVPYSAVFAVGWTAFLLAWVWLGLPLGPGAGLWYMPR